ncbi:MAG: family 78 glycoside hydrolase catalytic domain, partial [Firmicutes bacterium]|nr:family 78 glycoside hydrolase catalytic domain [Bacillota bacterium]
MEITEVLVQSVDKPLGTGGHPYFSWKIISEEKNTLQQNYRLTVTTQDGHVCMDTGVVSSRKNAYVPYSGEPLNSRTAYTVMLEVTDNHGETATAVSFFETGLLHREDWQSNWIIAEKKRKKAQPGFGKQFPSTLFRQSFPVKSGLKQARLYATAHGVYELYINGAPADERCFAPEHTVYGKYLCVQTYDVTKLLAAGSNAIGFHVGDGWYFSPNAKPNMKTDNQHAVLYQLELLYENGERQLVSSGEDAQTSEGPVVSADLYAGELYDAAREIRDWSKSTCREGQWTPAKVKTYGYDNLVPQCGDRVIAVERFPVKDVLRSPRGECILDFGQNLAGRVRITMPLKEGQRLRLEHCEVLDREGNYYNNIMSAGGVGKGCDQTDEYISDGADVSYEPHFTYHGFRYARLTVDGKAPETVDPAWFTAVLLSSEKKDVGSFSCSDEALNRLYRNIRYSQASNMLSIPTDCPQREKAGWTGDMLVYARTAMLNEDCTVLFSRWLENMSKEQDRYGIVPMVVPENGAYPMTGKLMNLMAGAKGKATSSGWGDAAVIVPYSMYEVTG